jgi:hypothetical protein
MERNPSCETNSRSAIQEIHHLIEPESLLPRSQEPTPYFDSK